MLISSVRQILRRAISIISISTFILSMISINNGNLLWFIKCDHPSESLLASQRYNRILKYAKCQTPFARVVNIHHELRLSAVKKYIPHCTILHYCGPHSGCCRQENEQCVPKTVKEVKLYFWTIELTPRGHKKGIEVITMKNHTECMCAPINQKPELPADIVPKIGNQTNLNQSNHHAQLLQPTGVQDYITP